MVVACAMSARDRCGSFVARKRSWHNIDIEFYRRSRQTIA